MPVSSPSYFPPNSSTDQVKGINAGRLATGAPSFLAGANAGNNSTTNNLIIIGDNSATGGYTNTGLVGSVVVGASSCPNNLDALSDLGNGIRGNLINLGSFNFPVLAAGSRAAGLLVIGSGIGNMIASGLANDGIPRNVLIGHNVWQGQTSQAGSANSDNVVIGYLAGSAGVGAGNNAFTNNVVVGSQSFIYNNANPGSQNSNVCIGFESLTGITNGLFSNNVVIGSNAANSMGNTSSNVLIGSATGMGSAGQNGLNTIVGANSTVTNGTRNTILGAGNTGVTTGLRCIVIGVGAGFDLTGTVSDQFIISTNDTSTGNTQRTLIYADMNAANIVLGKSTAATNRDFGGVPGTNMLKLLNGTQATGAAITNGGYFTVQAGILTWVDQSGTITQMSNSTPGHLIDSANVALTNNAAAQVATITNGPLAGNPTKWIPINDNGTIRNIPAW